VLLGVNVDHVATLRQARGTDYPDPVEAALLAERSGADSITVHLREDRRHIQEHDVVRLQARKATRVNLEMAVTPGMLEFAERVRPADCCLVPEKREELTTEGGLDVAGQRHTVAAACQRLAAVGIRASLFIDPDAAQVDAAIACSAPVIELHTGAYCDAHAEGRLEDRDAELARLADMAAFAQSLGLEVHAGHGLTYDTVGPIAAIPQVRELNIGHFLIGEAIFLGLTPAIAEMRRLMDEARA